MEGGVDHVSPACLSPLDWPSPSRVIVLLWRASDLVASHLRPRRFEVRPL